MHYTGTIWRPPYEAESILLQATAGYTHHKCKFCNLYDDIPFKFIASPINEIIEDLNEINQTQTIRKRLFLTGANPFVLNFNKLKNIAIEVKKYIPKVQTIGCFSRITDISSKSDTELKELRKLGYTGLTIGIECGDDETLRFMNKGYNSNEILKQCNRLDNANIAYNFFYLCGLYGKGKSIDGTKQTAKIFNQTNPSIIVSSMLTIAKTSKLYQDILNNKWHEETEKEKLYELKYLIELLDINVYFATMGVSNLFIFQGTLQEDKKLITKQIDNILNTIDECELRSYRENLTHL